MGKAFNSGYELRAVVYAVQELYDAREAEENRHEEELERIANELKSIRSRCSHPLTDYFPDASGNNDSMTKCQICDDTID